MEIIEQLNDLRSQFKDKSINQLKELLREIKEIPLVNYIILFTNNLDLLELEIDGKRELTIDLTITNLIKLLREIKNLKSNKTRLKSVTLNKFIRSDKK